MSIENWRSQDTSDPLSVKSTGEGPRKILYSDGSTGVYFPEGTYTYEQLEEFSQMEFMAALKKEGVKFLRASGDLPSAVPTSQSRVKALEAIATFLRERDWTLAPGEADDAERMESAAEATLKDATAQLESNVATMARASDIIARLKVEREAAEAALTGMRDVLELTERRLMARSYLYKQSFAEDHLLAVVRAALASHPADAALAASKPDAMEAE